MSVTIDGTGTVTGLSVGGLPDGSIAAADLANNAVDETKLKDALVADFTEVVVTASDSILLGDATDSGNTKRDTVQGILDLAGGLYSSIAIITDQKAYDVQGGTLTSGAWRTRDLNTEISDVDGIVSISSNQFTLQAGTYTVEYRSTLMDINGGQNRLYNITDSAVTSVGMSIYNTQGQSVSVAPPGFVVFTISGAKVYEIQSGINTTRTTWGMGHRSQIDSNTPNTYTLVKILKHS